MAVKLGKKPLAAVRIHTLHPQYPSSILGHEAGSRDRGMKPAYFQRSSQRTMQATMRSTMVGLCLALVLCAKFTAAEAPGSEVQALAEDASPPRGLAVYALSRGKGVPEATRAVLDAMAQLFNELKSDGKVIRIWKQRIGLEGETRLCAEFSNEAVAHETLLRLQSMGKDADLLELLVEPCVHSGLQ